MRTSALVLATLAMACGGGGPGGGCPTQPVPSLRLETLADGFARPIWVGQAPGDANTFYVAEQIGRIQLVRGGAAAGTFLDLTDTIGCPSATTGCLDGENNERGLLGMAFHPGYASNGRFYVYYADLSTGGQIHNRIVEYHRSATNPDMADPAEVARLLDVDDPETNHNGGNLAFGRDGMLYAGIGDGGGGCDGHGDIGNAQALDNPFGKMLRLSVDSPPTYAAPGNPFSGGDLAAIWAYGLRNPWRWSFDRDTGDLYIGDVGQDALEEIDIQPGASHGGENYGWRVYEGDQRSNMPPSNCADDPDLASFVHPIFTASHSGSGVLGGACAIVGGYVYRGSAIPDLRGWYLFSDNCIAEVVALRVCNGQGSDAAVIDGISDMLGGISSFGQDNAGELYLTSLDGTVSRIVAQ